MGKVYDVEAFRKKQKRKKRVKTLVTMGLVLILVAAAALIVIEWMRSEADFQQTEETFPINLKGETPVSLRTTQDSLVVTTEGAVNFYSKLAQRQNSVVHGFSKPVTKAAGNYVLTYDHGGYSLRLDTKGGISRTLRVESRILFAEVSESGMVAVAYADQNYTSGVSVYDENLDEPLCDYYLNEYAMALAFTGSDSCVIAAQTTQGSSFASAVYKIFFDQEAEAFQKTYTGSMIVSMAAMQDGVTALICEEETIFLDREGEQTASFRYSGTLTGMVQGEDALLFGLTNAADPNRTDLVLVGTDGETTASVTLENSAEDLAMAGNRIYALTKSEVLVYTSEMEGVETFPCDTEYQELAVLDGEVFGLSADRLEKLS